MDGEQRSALAVTRSLGARGIKVAVGAEGAPSLASSSRYCSEAFRYKSPYHDPAGFLGSVLDFAGKRGSSVLLPITDVTLTEILMHRSELPEGCIVPFVDFDTYDRATSKIRLYRLATELKVPVPESICSSDYPDHEALAAAAKKLGYPVVVKSGFSKIRTARGWVQGRVQYVSNDCELGGVLRQEPFRSFPFLVQERVEGPGIGIFLLGKKGEAVARFAHRRIREKPASGGVSVLCESIEAPRDAMRAAVAILAELGWTGVAMFEFKIDRATNRARLLEINGRFWGSLQLAITAGVDFPYLLYRLAKGEHIEVHEEYKYTVGLKSRWELGDLDHLLIRLLKNASDLNLPQYYPTRRKLFKEFVLDFLRSSVKNEVYQSADRRPFMHEFSRYVRHIIR